MKSKGGGQGLYTGMLLITFTIIYFVIKLLTGMLSITLKSYIATHQLFFHKTVNYTSIYNPQNKTFKSNRTNHFTWGCDRTFVKIFIDHHEWNPTKF